MSLSFQEKSSWLMLVGLVVAFGAYFLTVLPAPANDIGPDHVGVFVLVVVLLVAIQIVGHIVIAIADRRAETDERDRLIALKGAKYGAFVLATGVFAALCAAAVTDGNFLFAHVLLGAWVLAQLAEIGSRLYLYRREA